jgi:uncharacterized protein (DUF58 family)
MDPQLKQILKPEVINTVSGLELIARIIVEGFMSGGNRSRSIGIGQEFSQYRHYEPGDDLRQLDWKMFARSERYFIKQSEIETNIVVKFFIDSSKSMMYAENNISKLDYSKVLAAGIAYLARKQGDTYGLYAINESNVNQLDPRPEQQQFMRFLYRLIELKAQGKWWQQGLETILPTHGKEVVIFMSDLYDHEQDILKFVNRLKTPRNEAIVFHILGKQEVNLEYNGSFAFKDLETDTIVKVDTAVQRKIYQKKIQEWISYIKSNLLQKGIYYHQVFVNDVPEEVLRTFLKARKNLAV